MSEETTASRSVKAMLEKSLIHLDIGGQARTIYQDGICRYVCEREEESNGTQFVSLNRYETQGGRNVKTQVLRAYPEGTIVAKSRWFECLPYFVATRMQHLLNEFCVLRELSNLEQTLFRRHRNDFGIVPARLEGSFAQTLRQRFGEAE